jgi:hypothetical protein
MSGDMQTEWKAVDKGLPEKNVLLLIRTLAHVALGVFDEDDNFVDEDGDAIQCVTHWCYIYEPEGY